MASKNWLDHTLFPDRTLQRQQLLETYTDLLMDLMRSFQLLKAQRRGAQLLRGPAQCRSPGHGHGGLSSKVAQELPPCPAAPAPPPLPPKQNGGGTILSRKQLGVTWGIARLQRRGGRAAGRRLGAPGKAQRLQGLRSKGRLDG